MSSDTYSGTANRHSGTSESNRLDFVARSVMNRMSTSTPVIVRAVNGDGTVDIQPMVGQTDGAGKIMAHGTIHNVPVVRWQAGASAVVMDPVVGDRGLAVFAHTDISSVKKTRAVGKPGSRRRFDWADAMYLGGLLNDEPTQMIRFDPSGGITITAGAGLPVTINAPGGVTISTDDSVSISASGGVSVTGDLTVSGDITAGAGSTFNGKSFDDHTHGGVTTGTGTSGPPS